MRPGEDHGEELPLRPLPRPDDPVLREVLKLSASARDVYRFLYRRRHDPPTKAEIQEHDRRIRRAAGLEPRSQIERRIRDLYRHFVITQVRVRGEPAPRYRLDGSRPDSGTESTGRISGGVRARVLATQRCAMCGRTPLIDEVRLVVDHKLPRAWGGTDDEKNLQPLCNECNHGKQAWFRTYDEYADRIASAAQHDEPQKRIGELLKAFAGKPVPSDLLGVVASMGSFQEDWQKRMRELRELGWDFRYSPQRDPLGVRPLIPHYKLVHAEPWPKGTLRNALREARKRRRSR